MEKHIRNPFTPGKIMIDSTRYAGRDQLVSEAFEYLQDHRSLFITGQRGIGKSSFAIQLASLIGGDPKAFHRFPQVHRDKATDRAIISYRCLGHDDLSEIARNLISSLSKKLGITYSGRERTSSKWKFDFKLVSHEIEEQQQHNVPSIVQQFSECLITSFSKYPHLAENGISFFIDEVDLVISKIELGLFLKIVLENLSDSGIQTVTFVLVGISKSLSELNLQHPSISRYLVPICVPPMTTEELNNIIDRALDGRGVTFDPRLYEVIHMLSQGFPDPVHVLGYELFRLADETSRRVDFLMLEDVLKTIVTVYKKEEFASAQHRIPNMRCERILMRMTEVEEEYVNLQMLLQSAGMNEADYRISLIELEEANFIERGDLSRYRFKDPLFRVYLKMMTIQDKVRSERARLFKEISNIARQLGVNPIEEERRKREELLFDIILRNYKETGKTGMWAT